MNKKTVLLMIVIGTLSLVSCKKDRTCTCMYTSTSGTVTTTKTTYFKARKMDVRQKCIGSETTTEVLGNTTMGGKTTCELK